VTTTRVRHRVSMPYAALDVPPNQLLQTHGSLNFDDREYRPNKDMRQ